MLKTLAIFLFALSSSVFAETVVFEGKIIGVYAKRYGQHVFVVKGPNGTERNFTSENNGRAGIISSVTTAKLHNATVKVRHNPQPNRSYGSLNVFDVEVVEI